MPSPRLLPALLLLLAPRPAAALRVTLQNVAPRLDTDGQIIDAHDGKLIRVKGRYYLYGTTYRNCGGSPPCQFNATFSCYSSTDLMNWTKLSDDILPYSDPRNRMGHKDNDPAFGPGVQVRYRPHAVFNPKTQKYVLWYDWRNKGGGYGAFQLPTAWSSVANCVALTRGVTSQATTCTLHKVPRSQTGPVAPFTS
jgi:hypothetical protein